jgi:hypothetical protein
MSEPVTTTNSEEIKPVPPDVLAWAEEQDFRATVRRAIQSVRVAPRRKNDPSRPLWAAVAELLAVGSTYACRYCVLFGFDPDEKVRYS